MVTVKNYEQISKMKIAGKVLGEAIAMLKEKTQIGVNCLDLDKAFEEFITKKGCTSNFKGYGGFPKTICISINDQLVHGIPQNRVLEDGDIVSIDTGCVFEGYHADAAFTKIVGNPKNDQAVQLLNVTEESLNLAIKMLKSGVRIGDIGHTIQSYVESFGFSVPREYTGHGIGTAMHEDPFIPNYGAAGTGMRLTEGMIICIEPMVQVGHFSTKVASDKWTVYSKDGSMAAHFEHTILITQDSCEVLTK
ncbi:methionine aminopeptidase [Williamsoniiplasma somnilux]|uniref:Methionine aminopeptidase n=1 Tax=Williamsoniiplasma somnilux TaxID=215578 RepID=A0A2K8NXJ0_9MOLU|nr:type I methionyl aminopeptidase [Williamsoniiplasma somnilux]ATZ18539.1 methionine aminopeptidase [Williamsoniiplasma somnilux]